MPVIAVLNPRRFELPSKELARAQAPNLPAWVKVMTDLLDRA